MELLAHSPRPVLGIPAQSYRDHVRGVMEMAQANGSAVVNYWRGDTSKFLGAVSLAAEFHDLGKLDEANQRMLEKDFRRRPLPVNHVDAGVAYLFRLGTDNLLAATSVFSHHIGLPDFVEESTKQQGDVLRDTSKNDLGRTTKSLSDKKLDVYLGLHKSAMGRADSQVPVPTSMDLTASFQMLMRVALSCLVDADHSDSARAAGQVLPDSAAMLNPDDRLSLLSTYVRGLGEGDNDPRNVLRTAVYQACKRADPIPGFCACDSPVGTGKTTAVMAHLLRAAKVKGLRRIFVVLPFTNIIDQSVEVYRDALVDPSEDPEHVVAAQHHRAEFESEESRHLSFHWKAPIVVTTAVQFFETLAAHRPAALRKLHELPGSAIFIDEAHAALPAHLWPQAWKWLRELESEWGCHFVLGSGSLNRFWELEDFSEKPLAIPELVAPEVKSQVSDEEIRRIKYLSKPEPVSADDLIEWTQEIAGPRLLIVNTVQSAAVLAQALAEEIGRKSVEHLSTSLCPRDRESTLKRVKERLRNRSDTDWTLVATSCVEAGVNLSFRNGFRERCGLNSLIQIGGRVNRNAEFKDSVVWDFRLFHDSFVKSHPAFEASARILEELFREGKVNPESSTEAMRREVRQEGMRQIANEIAKAERNRQFPTVSQKFTVIDSQTVTVVVDEILSEKLEKREWVDPSIFQELSVQIWSYKQDDYHLRRITGYRDLFYWTLLYDDFLGYMKGVLQKLGHEQVGTII